MLLSVGLFDFDSQNLTELSDSVCLQRLTSMWHETDVKFYDESYVACNCTKSFIRKNWKKRIFMNVLYHINKSEKLYLNTVKKNQKNLRIQLIYNLTPIRESWKKIQKPGNE